MAGVYPLEYLTDILLHILTGPADRITELLPGNWRELEASDDLPAINADFSLLNPGRSIVIGYANMSSFAPPKQSTLFTPGTTRSYRPGWHRTWGPILRVLRPTSHTDMLHKTSQ